MDTIKFLGHAGFQIRLGDTVFLVDPAVSTKLNGYDRRIPSALSVAAVKECDLIFITHEHAPHCEVDTIKEIAERTYASVVAPRSALSMVDISSRFKVDVRIGDKFTIKGLDVEVAKAVHPQSTYPVGYVFRSPKYSIYHAGDTYSFTDMAKIKCDIALLPIGGSYTMDPFAAANVCKEIRPKYAIPMHYNTYERIAQEVSEFTSSLGTHTKPIILKAGETAKLP